MLAISVALSAVVAQVELFEWLLADVISNGFANYSIGDFRLR